MTNLAKTIKLYNDIEMPRIGLGVWKIENSKVDHVVKWAIETGYRHVDTARSYNNEKGVGKGINESGILRKDIFVTTKLAPFDIFRTKNAFRKSLNRLGLTYVDLYLVHWPILGWKQAWKVMENLFETGEIRAIGVSNFTIDQIEEMKRSCNKLPAVNQVELSPFLTRTKLVDYCRSNGIVLESYSPLTRARKLDNTFLLAIAKEYKKSPAQIVIRWGLQHNLVVLPKSETHNHINDNFDVFDFEISRRDMMELDGLNENYSVLPGWSRG